MRDMSLFEAERILGLEAPYSMDDAKAAQRKLLAANHPDAAKSRGISTDEATANTMAINEAFKVIKKRISEPRGETGTSAAQPPRATPDASPRNKQPREKISRPFNKGEEPPLNRERGADTQSSERSSQTPRDEFKHVRRDDSAPAVSRNDNCADTKYRWTSSDIFDQLRGGAQEAGGKQRFDGGTSGVQSEGGESTRAKRTSVRSGFGSERSEKPQLLIIDVLKKVARVLGEVLITLIGWFWAFATAFPILTAIIILFLLSVLDS